jgi:hypothetical protein
LAHVEADDRAASNNQHSRMEPHPEAAKRPKDLTANNLAGTRPKDKKQNAPAVADASQTQNI